ncbi:MAG: hypothetical protein GAK28_01672 [Luteibacter sp.]|uniref:hypothetical protein n=1 Tax=Luteibacter sp. TaxID=1886636 RepID=UPI001385870C|nr:hypothetical protein [Luteibacter sp.]KAF1007343.1 MAG: hypothetical protein GAK28_01982 [Luteibacter sp.]KAF1007715.1 MAG: hypothetical protein GAK28_01672 [Luteibacter sp.]
MKDTNQHWILDDDDASTEALLNEATEWFAYARGTASLLAECLGNDQVDVDPHELSLALGGIAALVAVGTHCIQRAHTQVIFDHPTTHEVPHVGG